MKTALEVIQAAGVSEAIYGEMEVRDLNKLAKTLDKTFVAPPADPIINFSLKVHTPEKGKNKGKTCVYLSGQVPGAFGGIFHYLNEGDKLTAEGRKALAQLLTTAATNAAALLESA